MVFANVHDVARAHVLAFENGEAGRYICANDCQHLSEWYKILKELYPEGKIPTELETDGVNHSIMNYLYDNAKLKGIGWEPKYTLRDSLHQTLDSLQKFEYLSL